MLQKKNNVFGHWRFRKRPLLPHRHIYVAKRPSCDFLWVGTGQGHIQTLSPHISTPLRLTPTNGAADIFWDESFKSIRTHLNSFIQVLLYHFCSISWAKLWPSAFDEAYMQKRLYWQYNVILTLRELTEVKIPVWPMRLSCKESHHEYSADCTCRRSELDIKTTCESRDCDNWWLSTTATGVGQNVITHYYYYRG